MRVDHTDIKYSPQILFQTLLVAGGHSGGDYLSTTEILVGTPSGWASEWVYTGALPSAREILAGINMNNKIYMTGN